MKKRVRQVAEESLERLQKSETGWLVNWFIPPNLRLRRQIATTAKATRFWSVWEEVFKNDADMLERLRKAKEAP